MPIIFHLLTSENFDFSQQLPISWFFCLIIHITHKNDIQTRCCCFMSINGAYYTNTFHKPSQSNMLEKSTILTSKGALQKQFPSRLEQHAWSAHTIWYINQGIDTLRNYSWLKCIFNIKLRRYLMLENLRGFEFINVKSNLGYKETSRKKG